MNRARVRRGLPYLGTLALLALAGCNGDPKDYGITGPFPDGVAAVTVTHQMPRTEMSDDSPGLNADALDRYSPSPNRLTATTGPGTVTAVTKRYYGYDR